MKRLIVYVAVAAVAGVCNAAESHADGVIARVLENVAKLKAAQPDAVPMAFWDFDGTIIKGDISEGLDEDGVQRFKGLIREGYLADFVILGGNPFETDPRSLHAIPVCETWLGGRRVY